MKQRKSYLEGFHQLSLEARLWYTSRLASTLHRGGRQADAKKLMDEVQDAKVTDVQILSELVRVMAQIGEIDAAERILAQVSATSSTIG